MWRSEPCSTLYENNVFIGDAKFSTRDMFKKQEYCIILFQFVFNPDPVPKGTKNAHTVHEELAKNLTTILRPANADNVVVCKFLKYSWFFFEILIKSMALYLINTDRFKVRELFAY